MPVGFNQDGLPMGVQIIGKNHADFAVLQLAYAYEQATNWVSKHLPPLIKDSKCSTSPPHRNIVAGG
jgi:amidase